MPERLPWYHADDARTPSPVPNGEANGAWFGSNHETNNNTPSPAPNHGTNGVWFDTSGGANGNLWGMFLFGGPPQAMEHWMEQMNLWGNRMEQWGNRWQGMQQGMPNPMTPNTPNAQSTQNGFALPPMELYDPTLEPLIDRWGER